MQEKTQTIKKLRKTSLSRGGGRERERGGREKPKLFRNLVSIVLLPTPDATFTATSIEGSQLLSGMYIHAHNLKLSSIHTVLTFDISYCPNRFACYLKMDIVVYFL